MLNFFADSDLNTYTSENLQISFFEKISVFTMDPSKNRRVQINATSGPLEVVTGPVPEAPAKGLLVKVDYAGICHSDVHIWRNEFKIPYHYPLVMGHEICGRIQQFGADVGSDKAGLSLGDRVVVYAWIGCGHCDHCSHGKSKACDEGGAYYLGCSVKAPTDGGYQDYLPVRSVHEVCRLPDSIPGDIGCLLGCSALTAFNAVKTVKKSLEEAVGVKGHANVLIIGAGGLGQWAVSMVKALCSKHVRIYAADSSEENLKVVAENGATPITWNRDASEEDIVERSKAAASGGFDASIDFIGLPVMMDRAFKLANKNATLAIVGLAGGTNQFVSMALIFNGITVAGVIVGNLQDNVELIELCTKHPEIKPPFMTHVKPEDAEDVLKKLEAGTYKGRAIIDFTK